MTNDQIAGRIKVLEVLTLTALGLYLANAKNDPDYSKATSVLDYIRGSISTTSTGLSPEAKVEAQQYASDLTFLIANNLRTMRGEVGQVQ
jgi:hypothetical protein